MVKIIAASLLVCAAQCAASAPPVSSFAAAVAALSSSDARQERSVVALPRGAAAGLPRALVVRGGATKTKPLKMKRSALGTLVLMVQAFFASLMDPTYMMESAVKKSQAESGGEGAVAEEDNDPFAVRAKAGLSSSGRTITVDELEKMGDAGGKSRVKAIKSTAEFKKALAAAGSKLVVVDFFATWCGPCKQIAPQFAQLSGQHKKVVFLKVDVDVCKELSGSYGVSSMPTFLYLKKGKVLEKQAGANLDAIKSKISQLS